MILEAYNTRIKTIIKTIIIAVILSVLVSCFISVEVGLYEKVKDLFSTLSDVYAILIGFNISAIIFIVSFMFKENNILEKFGVNNIKEYYSQIINSFMLSTIINFSIIVLGLIHIVIVNLVINLFLNKLSDILLYLSKVIYLSLWLSLIIVSIITFFRCLIILTRLLRIVNKL